MVVREVTRAVTRRVLPLLLGVGAWGCSDRPSEIVVDSLWPEDYRGTVDESLPARQQARQEALAELLNYLQTDEDFEGLPESFPDLRFSESRDTFLEGMFDLYGWDFAGPQQGDDVPVKLILREDLDPEFPEREVKRVYAVIIRGETTTIERKP